MFLLDEFDAASVLRVGPLGLRGAVHGFRRRHHTRHRLPVQLQHRAARIDGQPEDKLFHRFILGIEAHARHGGLRKGRGRSQHARIIPEAERSHRKTAARFYHEPTALLRNLAADIEAARFDDGGGPSEIPVKLKVHDSLFVPLAKWPVLLAGNYRCIPRDDMIPINEAVHANTDKCREIYDWVRQICTALGAEDADMVPFEKYAKAAEGLA